MSHKVLLVDDDTNLLNGLRRALRKEPFDLLCAASGEEALAVLRADETDVVVSDQDMPGMSGTVFLATVHRLYPDTVRFMLTGKATLDVAIEAINAGAISRFLTKPCNHVDLAVTIREALRQKDLVFAARRLVKQVRSQSAILEELEREQPGITRISRDSEGVIVLDDIPEDYEDLMDVIRDQLQMDVTT